MRLPLNEPPAEEAGADVVVVVDKVSELLAPAAAPAGPVFAAESLLLLI